MITESYLETKLKAEGSSILEREHPQKLEEFRVLVMSKMVRYWNDPREIKLAIFETLNEFGRRDDLIGWLPGSDFVDIGPLAEQVASLTKENQLLRKALESPEAHEKYVGVSFNEMYKLLSKDQIILSDIDPTEIPLISMSAVQLGHGFPTLLDFLWVYHARLSYGWSRDFIGAAVKLAAKSETFGLVTFRDGSWTLSDTGRQFIMRLRVEKAGDGLLSNYVAEFQ